MPRTLDVINVSVNSKPSVETGSYFAAVEAAGIGQGRVVLSFRASW
jgi:hypothetical protein